MFCILYSIKRRILDSPRKNKIAKQVEFEKNHWTLLNTSQSIGLIYLKIKKNGTL